MVSGHLTEKNGIYQIVLNLVDERGKRKPKWISTGIEAKRGNKKKAEAMLQEARMSHEKQETAKDSDILFADFIEKVWLPTVKHSIEETTLSGYIYSAGVVAPHFRKKGITLGNVKARDIDEFYIEQLGRVKGTTVIRYHACIHNALKLAVRKELIPLNPADNVDRPKAEQFIGSFYDKDEMNDLLNAVQGTYLELAVMLGFYGLRREEIVGLKWNAVDFNQNTISVQYTVTTCNLNGKRVIVEKDRTKNKSSRRTLPMIPALRNKLLTMQGEREEYRKLCRGSYNSKHLDFVYVDELGERIKPDYITQTFNRVLKKNGLRKIRFHDLRHSCASLLLANGVSMKQIQEWLGHSDFGTTANIYAHLSFDSKLSSADALNIGTAFANMDQGIGSTERTMI